MNLIGFAGCWLLMDGMVVLLPLPSSKLKVLYCGIKGYRFSSPGAIHSITFNNQFISLYWKDKKIKVEWERRNELSEPLGVKPITNNPQFTAPAGMKGQQSQINHFFISFHQQKKNNFLLLISWNKEIHWFVEWMK